MSTHIMLALDFVETQSPMAAELFGKSLDDSGYKQSPLVNSVWTMEVYDAPELAKDAILTAVKEQVRRALNAAETIQLVFYVVQVGNAAPVHESMSLKSIEENLARFTR
ncbi:hypothetical protein [Pseudomonas asiatica]|uniref:hypothetical protein n=1 Tax=Pseudomonas asiatica TaxID=2219225 RepID=UPI002365D4FB|nr:hypothetical protein [Pseudomonas asiatica]MDD1984931.1 hypothetical protein [Pseudomonas asiatica]